MYGGSAWNVAWTFTIHSHAVDICVRKSREYGFCNALSSSTTDAIALVHQVVLWCREEVTTFLNQRTFRMTTLSFVSGLEV